MEKYDYQKVVCGDIRKYLKRHNIIVTKSNRDEIYEPLGDEIAQDDDVVGTEDKGYTSEEKAHHNLFGNYDLLYSALWEFDDFERLERGASACDSAIRSFLVPICLDIVFDEVEIDG